MSLVIHKILCICLLRFGYFPFNNFLGQFVGHFCTEQKVIITKFNVDTFLIKVTFSIFSSIFTCIYIYTLYFVFILVIKLRLKYNKVVNLSQHLLNL